ncbi:MAG: PLP-dependent aminotransferase family protein [Chloroflexi bacterium]|nr:PLP-dependent aminotransferase family protein [Chloroflexota bacterium]
MLNFAIHRDDPQPIYEQLKAHLVRQIEHGVLAAGERLPSSRDLAEQLGIGRISVVTAYEDLKLAGYLEARVGRGTFVAEREIAPDERPAALTGSAADRSEALLDLMKLVKRPDVLNFSQGTPADSFLPVDVVGQAINQVLARDGAAAIAYEAPNGYLPLREAIAERVAQVGIHVDAEEVLITGGCQQALDLAVQALLSPGDVILTSNPTYAGMIEITRARGVTPVGVPVDEDGLVTDRLEALIIEHRPRLIYVAPTYHNPTGTVMPLHRRRHLLRLAQRYHLPVLEDGVYEDLSYVGHPPPPLKALDDSGLILYASSFSKVLMPGMRIGYLLAGERLYERVARVKRAADVCTPALNQRALHAALTSGALGTHLAEVKAACIQRRAATLAALAHYWPEVQFTPAGGGLYQWLQLPQVGPTATELFIEAVHQGVAFAPGDLFYVGGGDSYHLRFNMVAQPPHLIDEGVGQLADIWRRLAEERSYHAHSTTPMVL